MRTFVVRAVACSLFLAGSVLSAGTTDRLQGRVIRKDGRAYQGLIRWGANEASWFDFLDGSKRLPESHRQAALKAGLLQEQQTREIRLLGFKVAEWDEGEGFPETVQSALRFGHVERIVFDGENRARLILKSDEEVLLEGSIDFGKGIPNILVEDLEHGTVEVGWQDVDSIELLRQVSNETSKFGERLFGTLLTAQGPGFTGFICWDMDEMFTEDRLDGEVNGEKRSIRFGDIRTLERVDSTSSRVTLVSGEAFRITGSNDVNDENRDILVLDVGLGQVRVGWNDFGKLVLLPPPADLDYGFDGGHRLRGAVETEEGDLLQGWIRWDNDETFSWEVLDGNQGGVRFDVELGLVRSIERSSLNSGVVTLNDGRQFELNGSNDVNQENKGIFVSLEDGSEAAIPWKDFHRLTLDHAIPAERPVEQ